MSITVSRDIIESVADYLDKDIEVREYDSGRGTCLGIVTTDISGLVEFVDAAARAYYRDAEYDLDDFISRIGSVQEDSMGLNIIYYWPGVQLS